MSGPPRHIEPSALWSKLEETPRPSQIVDFPRKDANGEPIGQVAIWVLTHQEQQICTTAAEKFARQFLKDGKRDEIGYEALYTNAVCVEVLFRACRLPEDLTRSAFPAPSKISEILTTDECAALFSHYLTVQMELGPVSSRLSDEEAEAWIDRIGEAGSAFPFNLLSWEVQQVLLLILVNRVKAYSTATISSSTPPEEPSVEPAPEASEPEPLE